MNHDAQSVLLFANVTLGLLLIGSCRGEQQSEARESSGDALQPEPHGSDTHPDWSPDGASIAFISNRDGVKEGREIDFEVYRVEVNGSGERRLAWNQDFDANLAWSPDGTRILFKSYEDQNDEIYLVDAAGGNSRNLTHSHASGGGGAWSPDGSTIFFPDRGSEDRTRSGYPKWSPDGLRIAHTIGNFESDRWAVVLSDADGGNLREIVRNPDGGNAAWSPDGRRLILGRYSRYGESSGKESQLFILDPQTEEATRLLGGVPQE